MNFGQFFLNLLWLAATFSGSGLGYKLLGKQLPVSSPIVGC